MKALLAACMLLFISSPAFAVNEAGNKTSSTDNLSPKVLERISLYETSIKYWDTGNIEVKKFILKELAEEIQVKVPGCPRIRFPMICDNDGTILENICYFKMRRKERAGLLPVLVFTSTPIDQARDMCTKSKEKELRKP